MSLIDRILPVEEWAKLKGTDLDPFLADATFRARARIFVVEREGRIVGRVVHIRADHAEASWIDPEERGKGVVARHLWLGIQREIAKTGATTMIISADDPDIAQMFAKRATPFPAQEFVVCLHQ